MPRPTIAIVPYDRAAERAAALAHSGILALGTTLAVSIALVALDATGTVLAWLLVGGAGVVSTGPVVRYALAVRRGGRRLPVWHLGPRWHQSITGAAAEAARLRVLADDAPPGPVADHLQFLATRAEDYVVALHDAATVAVERSAPGMMAPDTATRRLLEADAARIVAELGRLTEAAEQLQRAQQQHLTPSPLSELIDRTQRITEALEAQTDQPPRPSS